LSQEAYSSYRLNFAGLKEILKFFDLGEMIIKSHDHFCAGKTRKTFFLKLSYLLGNKYLCAFITLLIFFAYSRGFL